MPRGGVLALVPFKAGINRKVRRERKELQQLLKSGTANNKRALLAVLFVVPLFPLSFALLAYFAVRGPLPSRRISGDLPTRTC